MKKLLVLIGLTLNVIAYSQASSKINNAQNTVISVPTPDNLISADGLPEGTWRKNKFSDLRFGTNQITGLETFIQSTGNTLWQPLLGYAPVNNMRTITINGVTYDLSANRTWNISYLALTDKPTSLAGYGITDAYPLLGNPSGFLTSFTELDPTVSNYAKSLSGFNIIKSSTDLLYYPLSTNPAGYLTSVPAQSWASITGKPSFSNVATSGDYVDLINKPTIPAAQLNSDWNSTTGISQILNKPVLSTVATTGSYADLTNKPSIPASQVSSDWNATTGVAQILNKPSIYNFTGLTNQYTRGDGTYATFPTAISSFTNDVGFITGVTSTQINTALGYTPYNGTTNPNGYVTSSGLSSTLSGYTTNTSLTTTLGNYVTASSFSTTLGSYATTASVNSGLATKENTITAGTTAQYWRGDKTWQTLNTSVIPESTNLYYTDSRARASNSAGTGISYNTTTGVITNSAPDQVVTITGAGGNTVTGTYPNFTITGTTGKRQLTYSGVTDASGNYTVTFATPFAVAPNIQQNLIGGNALQGTLITSITATGFTIQAYTRSTVSSLPIVGVLTATLVGVATNPLVGGTVDVLITEK